MIAITARGRMISPPWRISIFLPLLGILLLPIALVALPILLMICPPPARNEALDRFKRGEITFADAVRQMEAEA